MTIFILSENRKTFLIINECASEQLDIMLATTYIQGRIRERRVRDGHYN